jgi:hypothetical protein
VNAPAIRERNPDDRIYNGLEFSVLEIEDAGRILAATIKALRENIDARHMVGVKLSSEQLVKVANQISGLSAGLKNASTVHVNRRPR